LNDYARGALEALAWVESLLTRGDLETLRREVVGPRSEILVGASVDFRNRLRAAWAFELSGSLHVLMDSELDGLLLCAVRLRVFCHDS
jgi:hypothetical protein